MYRSKKVALVIPSHNESRLIGRTLTDIPASVDRVFVVDDASTDNQNVIVTTIAGRDPRIHLIKLETNQGPGGAIIAGYTAAHREGYDIVAVIGADKQMDLAELENFLDPIVDDQADYVKGNRFLVEEIDDTIMRMPKLRFFANWLITALTKIASGYFQVTDVVDGYTAISREAIGTVKWEKAWKGYGYPMDFLIRLNAYGIRMLDVPRRAIYLPGERQSQIRPFKYFLTVSLMLWRSFMWRLRFKYLYLDFHPLVFFYFFSFCLIPLGMTVGGWLVIDKLFFGGGNVTAPRAVLVAFMLITGIQFLLFAMFFDREESKSWKPLKQLGRSKLTPVSTTTVATANLMR